MEVKGGNQGQNSKSGIGKRPNFGRRARVQASRHPIQNQQGEVITYVKLDNMVMIFKAFQEENQS